MARVSGLRAICFFRVWVLQVCISAVEILHILGKGYSFVTLLRFIIIILNILPCSKL